MDLLKGIGLELVLRVDVLGVHGWCKNLAGSRALLECLLLACRTGPEKENGVKVTEINLTVWKERLG